MLLTHPPALVDVLIAPDTVLNISSWSGSNNTYEYEYVIFNTCEYLQVQRLSLGTVQVDTISHWPQR